MEISFTDLVKEFDEFEDTPWRQDLTRDNKGKVKNDIDNYILFFKESDMYKGKLRYNDFLKQREYGDKLWDDFDESIAAANIEKEIGLSNVGKIRIALDCTFSENRYNPIQDYLRSLKWDGKSRIENVFIRLLEADDTELNREMSRKWFLAAVKRVMYPGCKFDNILIFQGAQGIGKTTICEKISRGFFNVILLSELNNKDIYDKLNKTWIGIVDEMDAFNKKDMTSIKTFLSTAEDSVRLAYGRNTEKFKRHCIFIGSTNDDTFLRDSTASTERRFWIIKSKKMKYTPVVNETLTKEYVDQLWAEAYEKLMEDVDQYLDIDSELYDDFAQAQREFKTFTDDTVIDNVRKILDRPYLLNKSGEFSSDNDFLHQYTEENVPIGELTYINKIPMSSLKYVLYNVYKENRPSKYINIALGDEWEYKPIFYGGKTIKGLYRVNKNIQVVNNDQVSGNIPF